MLCTGCTFTHICNFGANAHFYARMLITALLQLLSIIELIGWILCFCYAFFLFADKLLVQQDPALYGFINQGCLTVNGMNDKEEMDIVDVRFDIFNSINS